MDDKIIAVLGITTLLTIALVGVAEIGSRYELDQAYTLYINTPIVRNEWGQLRHTSEFMCEASIRQWLKECGK